MASGPGPLLAVFDVDGTLIDSQHNIVAAVTEAWRHFGLPIPKPEAIRRVIGLSLPEAIGQLMPGTRPEEHRRVAEMYKEIFVARRQQPRHEEPLFPGVLETLKRLAEQNVLLGIATGKSRRGLDAVLDRHGLNDHFMTLQTADTGPGKPHPDMLLRAIREAKARPERTVMIGDTTYDMKMAVRAGAIGVGVGWGYHEVVELRQTGAYLVIDHFRELPPIVSLL